VLSDQVGAADDLVVEGQTGFVFPVDNHIALKNILIELLASPDLSKSIGAEARRKVLGWNHDMAVRNFVSSVQESTQEALMR